MPSGNALSEERLEVLKALYPWYKNEVFRRREQMIWLTGCACGVLVLLLVVLLVAPAEAASGRGATILTASGVGVFYGIAAYLILQQRARHLLAKQVLIKIEQELGLYEAGRVLEGAALYPQGWQTQWQHDRSVVLYLTVPALLSGLVILAMFFR